MIFKICYKEEIHKLFSSPLTFQDLLDQVTDSFYGKLPAKYSLQYRDDDGDFITISSDFEYQSMKAFDLSSSRFSFKIFVVPNGHQYHEGRGQFIAAKKHAEGSFEIIQDQSQNSSKDEILELNLSAEEEIQKKEEESPNNVEILRSRGSLDLNNQEVPEYHDFESSVHSHNTTINMIESRALALKHQKHRANDLEDDNESVDEQEIPNRSLERILTSIEARRWRRIVKDYSFENSPREEEDDLHLELASIRLRNIERNFRQLLSSSFIEDSESDSENLARQAHRESLIAEKRMLEQHNAAFVIQAGWRNYKIKQLIRRILQIESANLEREYEQIEIERQMIQQEERMRRRFIPLSDESVSEEYEEEEYGSGGRREIENVDLNEYSDSFSFENEDMDEQGPQRPPNFFAPNSFPKEQNNRISVYDDIRARLDSIPSISIEPERSIEEVRTPAGVYSYQLLPVKRANYVFLGAEDVRRTVFQTIYVINNGNKRWRKCLVKSVGAVSGETLEIYNVEVGQLVLVTLQLNGNFGVGNYVSQWKMVHENENGVVENVGETFEVEFQIMQKVSEFGKGKPMEIERTIQQLSNGDGRQGSEISGDDHRMEEESYSESEEEEEQSESEEEEEEEQSFSDDESVQEENLERVSEEEVEINLASFGEIAKVKRLTTQFPCDPWDEIHDFVVDRPNFTVDQLLSEYRLHRKMYHI